MSSIKLGDDAEMLCAKTLERMDYAVHVAGRDHAVGARRYAHDLYHYVDRRARAIGMFDVLGISTDGVVLASVKARGTLVLSPTRAWQDAVVALPQSPCVSYEWWCLDLSEAEPMWNRYRRLLMRWEQTWWRAGDLPDAAADAQLAGIGKRALAAALTNGDRTQ